MEQFFAMWWAQLLAGHEKTWFYTVCGGLLLYAVLTGKSWSRDGDGGGWDGGGDGD